MTVHVFYVFYVFYRGVCKGVCKGVYRGAIRNSAPRKGQSCINVSMFSDIPFERLDRYLEDIVKFGFY